MDKTNLKTVTDTNIEKNQIDITDNTNDLISEIVKLWSTTIRLQEMQSIKLNYVGYILKFLLVFIITELGVLIGIVSLGLSLIK